MKLAMIRKEASKNIFVSILIETEINNTTLAVRKRLIVLSFEGSGFFSSVCVFFSLEVSKLFTSDLSGNSSGCNSCFTAKEKQHHQ